MDILKKHNKTFIFIGLLLYKLALDLSYILFVNPKFSYVRFNLNFSLYKYILATIVFVLLYFLLPDDKKRPSAVIQQIHFILIFIPMISIYPMMNFDTYFFVLAMGVFALECILLNHLPNVRIPKIKNNGWLLYGILGAVTAFTFFSMIRANGFPSLAAINLNDVYGIRANLKFPFLMGYLVPWQSKVINPFFIAAAYKKENKLLLILSVGLQFFLFLITAEKAALFIPVVIIFVMWAVRKFNFIDVASFLLPFGIFFLTIFTYFTNKIEIASLFIRRLLFLPAQIKFYWYEFFSQNPLILYSQGIIGKIFGIRNPYPVDAAKVIGDKIYGAPNMHSNAGYIADAYGNGGTIGVIAIGIIFVLLLKIIDSLSIDISNEFVIGLIIFHVISLNDGSLVTAMITGGLLPLILILWLYSSEKRLD